MKNTFTNKNLIVFMLVTVIAITSVYLTGCSMFEQNPSIDSKYKVVNRWIEEYNSNYHNIAPRFFVGSYCFY